MGSEEHITSKLRVHLIEGALLLLALAELFQETEKVYLGQSLLGKTSAFSPSKAGGAGQAYSIWISSFELFVESSFYEAVLR